MFAELTSAFVFTVIDAPVLQSANLSVTIEISVKGLNGLMIAFVDPRQPLSS